MPEPRQAGVRYLGFLSEEDKAPAMAGAVAVVCPSPYESLSIVLLEGFSLGTPGLVNAGSAVLEEHCRRSNAGLFYADGDEYTEALDLLVREQRLRDLLGDGYQGTMNYAAFTRPLWQWLLPPQPRPYAHGKYPMLPNLPGQLVVSAMRELSGVTPWQGTLHAMNLIGSHDTHRIISLLGDPQRVDVAFGMLAAYPGVPMIYAGDEIGLATMGPEYARIPMPWAHPERWDQRRLASTQALFGARAASATLRRGGLRWLSIAEDALTFLREAPGESVLVHAARAQHPPIRLPAAVLGSELVGLAGTADLRAGADGWVTLPAGGPAFGMWRLPGDQTD